MVVVARLSSALMAFSSSICFAILTTHSIKKQKVYITVLTPLSVVNKMLEYVLVATSVLTGCFSVYAIHKFRKIDDILLDKLNLVLTEIRENPELQQKVYSVGLLLGAGIKQGVGFGKPSGKGGFEQLLVQGLAQLFLGSKKEEESNPFAKITP